MNKILLPLIAAILAAPAAAAQPSEQRPAPKAEEVRIPFAGFRLRDFRAESRDVVYLQDYRRQWYRAEVIGPCTELPFANAIGIDTGGTSSFDRFSAIVVGGERCPLLSLTRSEKPAKRVKKQRR